MKRLLSLIFICSLLLSNPIFAQGPLTKIGERATEIAKESAKRYAERATEIAKKVTKRYAERVQTGATSYLNLRLPFSGINWQEHEKFAKKMKEDLEIPKNKVKKLEKNNAGLTGSNLAKERENSLMNAQKLHNENYDQQMSRRGLVKEKHIMSQSNNSKSITENEIEIDIQNKRSLEDEIRVKVYKSISPKQNTEKLEDEIFKDRIRFDFELDDTVGFNFYHYEYELDAA